MAFNFFNIDRLTALAVRMKKGDRKAAAALYDELSSKVYGFFFARTGRKETAEDLSQDIFLRLVEKVGSFDEKRGRFVVWFWRMAHNMLIDHYRGKKETPFSAFSDDEVEGMAVAGGTSAEDRERYRALREFLRTLSEGEQELFELHYVAEVPYREIARIVGRSEGSLRVAALRLKEKIKKGLKR
jgi:RNA polymerase sigma-70 factor, ECF subfamily